MYKDFIEKLANAANQPKNQGITDIKNVVMTDDYTGQLKLVQELQRSLDLIKIVTPVNYTEERDLFLDDPTGHPIFEYDRKYLDEISSTFEDEGKFIWQDYSQFSDGTIRKLLVSLLENRARDLCATAEFVSAMEARSSHWQNQIMLEKYGSLNQDLVMEATLLADELRFPDEYSQEKPPRNPRIHDGLALMSFDAQAIKSWFDYALAEYGWEIESEITDEYHDISVISDYDGIHLYIPEDKTLNGIELLALIRREIECRIRDKMNTSALLRPFGVKQSLSRRDNDLLSEGHAILEEEALYWQSFGEIKKPDPWYIIAMELARKGRGFCQVANQIFEYLSECHLIDAHRLTWKYTYHVFRGSQNTFHIRADEDPFVFLKDKVYLEGYLLAKELQAAGLYHWLELGGGGLTPDELLEIANTVDFQPENIPYQDKKVTDKVYRSLLTTLEEEHLV